MRTLLSFRLPTPLAEFIDLLANRWGTDRTSALARILDKQASELDVPEPGGSPSLHDEIWIYATADTTGKDRALARIRASLLANAYDLESWTRHDVPLLSAAIQLTKGDAVLIKLLLTAGAKVDSPDQDGNTPLAWAVHGGGEAEATLAAVDQLLAHGAWPLQKSYALQGSRIVAHAFSNRMNGTLRLIQSHCRFRKVVEEALDREQPALQHERFTMVAWAALAEGQTWSKIVQLLKEHEANDADVSWVLGQVMDAYRHIAEELAEQNTPDEEIVTTLRHLLAGWAYIGLALSHTGRAPETILSLILPNLENPTAGSVALTAHSTWYHYQGSLVPAREVIEQWGRVDLDELLDASLFTPKWRNEIRQRMGLPVVASIRPYLDELN